MPTRTISQTIDLTNKPINKYITEITGGGIKVHDSDDILNYIQLTSEGMEVFKTDGAEFNPSAVSVAKFGETVRIGKTNEAHIVQTSTGLNFVDSSGITQASMTANNGTFVLEDVISAHKIELGSGLTIENNQGEILASFGTDGAQIGKDDESHLKMSFNSMGLADRVGTSYLEIVDNDIIEEVTETIDDFDSNYFGVNYPIYQVLRLAIDGVETSDYSYRKGSTTIDVFDTKPSSPVSLSVTYTTVALGKYYNFGYRQNDYPKGKLSVIEGLNTVARGDYSHAEGRNSYAQGEGAHTEGNNTYAAGQNSHAEGAHTNATGHYSHAEGLFTYATGYSSHAQNSHTIASKADQTALGRYNIEDTATTTADQKALIIGNGTSDNARSNALTVDWQGNVEAAGYMRDTIISATPTITRTSGGTIVSTAYKRSGNVATLRIVFASSGAVAGGANIFEGTLPSGYRPAVTINGCGYYGKSSLMGQISATGELIIRNASSTSNTFTSAGMTFTYIID